MRKLKIPNELRRFFNSMFLTIAISFIFFVILNLKGIDGQYDKLFSSIGSVGSIFIGYGAYRISQEQKRNIDLKISEDTFQRSERAFKAATKRTVNGVQFSQKLYDLMSKKAPWDE